MNFDLSINPEEVLTIIKDFIRTYIRNSGNPRVVIGLSGGVDSAITAIVCKDALGKKNTQCLFMPDESTPEADICHQRLVVNRYNILCKTKDINPVIQQLNKHCFIKPDRHALANIKTRIRMLLLYAYANTRNSIVCGTSNKSELLIGYFTKYGDGGVDIQPLGDLYKTQVIEIAKFLSLPEEMIVKSPSAGLWKGQTDEKELGFSYKELDKILFGLEQKLDINYIAKAINVKQIAVEQVKKMCVKSHHKRCSPLIPKIGVRTPGLDWRLPVQEG